MSNNKRKTATSTTPRIYNKEKVTAKGKRQHPKHREFTTRKELQQKENGNIQNTENLQQGKSYSKRKTATSTTPRIYDMKE
jgi:hypothetical protein